MNSIQPKHYRILAIAPSTRGFGFAVLEAEETLVDWGVKSVKGDKNTQSIKKVGELIDHNRPDAIVLADASAKSSRRSARVRALTKQIISLATTRKISVAVFPHEKVRQVFFDDVQGTKYALAKILTQRFPEELGGRLPPKRRPWMSEDYRMDIFDAVALALTLRLKESK